MIENILTCAPFDFLNHDLSIKYRKKQILNKLADTNCTHKILSPLPLFFTIASPL